MADRLSKITTRTGDRGTTGLGDSTRVSKDDARIHALGEVDELNGQIGVLLCEALPGDWTERLLTIQHDLFDLGGELCIPGCSVLSEAHVDRLEDWVATSNATLPALREFILPGGSRPAALAHVCRTVCRRAERAMVRLGSEAALGEWSLRYVNRLSDLLFIAARDLNRTAGIPDRFWEKDRRR